MELYEIDLIAVALTPLQAVEVDGGDCLSFGNVVPSPSMRNVYDQADVQRFLDHLIEGIADEFAPDQPLNIVGVLTRGETIGRRIAIALVDRGFSQVFRGALDVTLYRDDLSGAGARPVVRPTNLSIPLDGNPLVLADDVLFTGRSVRAALNLLNDFGRPRVIRLAVLVDRNGRELPIHADYHGLKLRDIPRDHRVNVKLTENDGVDEIVVEPKASV